ncbi:unnamed protein product [Oppiella nova]|nr:unnamed protein product [Oppiella nova]CAG2161506.1 unnamed protein product [Oppiella nova]
MANTPEDEDINIQRKKSSSRDPLSHRIIEKRRRDRMNNCLADLSRLIPTSYLKKSSSLQGRGRIEKTEIIEMAIKHMKHLQAHKYCTDDSKCDLSNTSSLDEEERVRQYRLGYQECLSEAIRFLVEMEGLFTGDGLCRRMMDYLHNHMSTLHKVNQTVNESDIGSHPLIGKSRTPSMSESTTSANEKMDINDSDMIDTKPYHSKPVVTSHLREMLESSATSKCSSKSSPQMSLSSGSPSVSPNGFNPNGDQNVYNFKKEIKDRFQANQKVVAPPMKSISPSLTSSAAAIDDERVSNSSLSSLATQASDHRSETSGYSSNSSSKSLPTTTSSKSPVFVPIFALHPSGNYYLPLTVDAALIGPQITAKDTEINSYPVLHPINITVNFSYQTPQLPAPLDYSQPPVWPPMVVHSSLVVTQCQHHYCLDCIVEWLMISDTNNCPQCDQSLTTRSRFRDNMDMDQVILIGEDILVQRDQRINNITSKWRIRCDYHWNGCQEVFPLEELSTHVKTCSHNCCQICGLSVGLTPEDHNCLKSNEVNDSLNEKVVDNHFMPQKSTESEIYANGCENELNVSEEMSEDLVDIETEESQFWSIVSI